MQSASLRSPWLMQRMPESLSVVSVDRLATPRFAAAVKPTAVSSRLGRGDKKNCQGRSLDWGMKRASKDA